jgi:hypothetical protein
MVEGTVGGVFGFRSQFVSDDLEEFVGDVVIEGLVEVGGLDGLRDVLDELDMGRGTIRQRYFLRWA